MSFWGLVLIALAVLGVQWGMLSLVALAALRKRVCFAVARLGREMQRFKGLFSEGMAEQERVFTELEVVLARMASGREGAAFLAFGKVWGCVKERAQCGERFLAAQGVSAEPERAKVRADLEWVELALWDLEQTLLEYERRRRSGFPQWMLERLGFPELKLEIQGGQVRNP